MPSAYFISSISSLVRPSLLENCQEGYSPIVNLHSKVDVQIFNPF